MILKSSSFIDERQFINILWRLLGKKSFVSESHVPISPIINCNKDLKRELSIYIFNLFNNAWRCTGKPFLITKLSLSNKGRDSSIKYFLYSSSSVSKGIVSS